MILSKKEETACLSKNKKTNNIETAMTVTAVTPTNKYFENLRSFMLSVFSLKVKQRSLAALYLSQSQNAGSCIIDA